MAMAVVAAPSQAHRTEPTTFTQDGFPHVLLPTHGLHRTATTRRFRRFKPATNAAARPPDQTPKQYHSGRARTRLLPDLSSLSRSQQRGEGRGLGTPWRPARGRSRNEFEKGWAVIFPSRSRPPESNGDPRSASPPASYQGLLVRSAAVGR